MSCLSPKGRRLIDNSCPHLALLLELFGLSEEDRTFEVRNLNNRLVRIQGPSGYNVVTTFPYAWPLCGLPSLGSYCGDGDTYHLYDVHEHVHWQQQDLWLELRVPKI
nr:hypothetical reductase-associated protein - hamster [Cricetinae gen. sp.]